MQNPETGNAQTTRPKIFVLGATGGTGHLIVAQALARGYDVTVLVRSVEKARDLNLKVKIHGNGYVIKQSPGPGVRWDESGTLVLNLQG